MNTRDLTPLSEAGKNIGLLMVAAGRALDDPKKEHTARRVLFRLSRPVDIQVYRIQKREEK